MKNLDDNYYDVFKMITELKGKQYDIEQEIANSGGGDGPDWIYVSGYGKCIEDLEVLIKKEDDDV